MATDSLATSLPRPGLALGPYPERAEPATDWHERMIRQLGGWWRRHLSSERTRMRRFLEQVTEQGTRLQSMTDGALRDERQSIRRRLWRSGPVGSPVVQAFALVRELAGRSIGLRHYDTQVMAGWVMINGRLAEMETGEGKTLAATLPAATAALAGIPVHVITVNDYLAARDADAMGPLYRALGLSVGSVVEGMEENARRAAYACDITYTTNKQIAFDYLRDRLVLDDAPGPLRLQLERLHGRNGRQRRLLLRGLCFAIVDEADSVLIDEARTPLIISRAGDVSEQEKVYRQALQVANLLKVGVDFSLHEGRREIHLTATGRVEMDELLASLKGVWSGARRREELVQQALCARYLYHRDHHYLVREGRVEIIDEYTGRVMADRSWERGLQQMIEVKEACPITGRRETLARLSYQHFFRRYLKLAGMTGTAREVAAEFGSVYGIDCLRLPTHRPGRRVDGGVRVFPDAEQKWRVIVARIQGCRRQGRPVLVGTRSLADSEHLSSLLQVAGCPHQVLNARQDEQEAAIVSRAGEPGAVTVATNMAGRGTDILLGPGVADSGGLHVIASERNDARRIDRQLFGRCARQGDPGSFEAILSLEDQLMHLYCPNWLRSPLRILLCIGGRPGQGVGSWALSRAQAALEWRHRRVRRDLLRTDRQLNERLAFSGHSE